LSGPISWCNFEHLFQTGPIMPPRPSDAAYKLLYSSPRMVADLIRGFVPIPWLTGLDERTLVPLPTELVGADLSKSQTDQIWRAQSPDKKGDVLLHLEFQSGSQRILPARMHAYSAQILLREARRLRSGHRHGLPPVVSIVLYNGKRRWRGGTHLAKQCRSLPETPQWSLPQHRFAMIDIGGQDGHRLAKLSSNIAALVMQLERPHQFDDALHILMRLKELLPGDHELRRDNATWYRAVAGDSSIVAPLLDEFVNPKGTAVTLAEKFEKHERRKLERARVEGLREGQRKGLELGQRKGMELGQRKGMELGQRKGSCNTLVTQMAKRFGRIPQDVRKKLEGATDAQIKRWAVKLLDAPTLDDVFKPAR
jgi:hypothetical protein